MQEEFEIFSENGMHCAACGHPARRICATGYRSARASGKTHLYPRYLLCDVSSEKEVGCFEAQDENKTAARVKMKAVLQDL